MDLNSKFELGLQIYLRHLKIFEIIHTSSHFLKYLKNDYLNVIVWLDWSWNKFTFDQFCFLRIIISYNII